MAAQTFRLVFQGKIAPDQDLDQVKTRMQQLFKKDAATIEKLFSGKKIPLKQGLNQSQAIQYREKLRALGIVCEMESQGSIQKPAANAAKPNRSNTTAHSASANKPLKFADIDKAFTDHLPRFEPSFAYKAGIVGVGIIMVLLPIVYLALIMVVGYGVLHHSIVNTGWMGSFGYKLGTVAYITPIIVGVTIILFMLKPLFARPVDEPKTTNVDPLQEPLFIHFVSKVALAVGAPRPKQILIDCDVNASASFHRGLFGFISNELVLTIGMPLIAGLNARQLAGVLAHEFGHFSQGAGMRFHYLTYKINSWLFKAVYTRDTWDQKLDNAAAEAPGWLHIILNVARGGVWASRKILTVFLMTGHAVSSYMLRQMEFDADRYEIYLAGSEQFRDTTLQFQKLGAAYQVSHDHLAKAWEEKKLVNDFPSLIAHNAEQLSPQASKALLKQMEQDKTGVYDSHPTDKQRIEKALQEGANGVFNLNCEGRELLKTFTYLAKRVTVHHYANDLGLEFEKDKLVDVEQVVKITRDHEHQQEAYHDYFKEMAPVFRFPLSVNIFDTSNLDWDKLLEQYQEVNDRIANEAVTRNRLMSQVNKAYRTYQIFDTIDLLKQGGLVMLPEWFDLNDELYNKHKAQLEKAEQTWQQFMQQLKPMFELNDQRLSIALTLLNHPRLIERNREHAHHLKMRNRLSLLINNFKRNTETILNFESRKFRLMSFLSCARAIGQKAPQVQEVTERLMEEYKQAFSQLSSCLHRLDYPFVGDGEHETVAGHLETLLPKRTQCGSELEYYLSSGNVIEEKLEVVYERVMSGLAAVALTVDCLLPTLDQEPENQTQQQLAVGENATQGNTALAQSNPAFSSADSSTQDKTEKPSDSAMAFYEMAVMGSSSAKNPIMPEDMNPGATQSDGASSAPDKDQSATEAIKNLVGETSQNTQSPQGAKPASTNKDRNAGAGSVKEPALSVANESKPVESSPRAKVGAAATNENNVDSNNDKPKPVEKQAAEIKAVELSPETKADAAGTISNKTNVDSDNVTLAEHQPASNALPAEPKTPKPAPTSENRLQLATDALREQANKTKAAISAAAAARKKDDTAPNESNEVVSQSVAGSEPAIGSLSAEPKSDVTAGKHDQQQQGDSAPLQANKASNVELTLVPDAGPSQTSGTDNAASHQDQDQSQSSGTSESSADKQTATEPHAASQHSSNDAMAQSIDHLKQTINNLSLEPRDDSPVTDSESVTETLTDAKPQREPEPENTVETDTVEHTTADRESLAATPAAKTPPDDETAQVEYPKIEQTVIGVMAAMEDIDEELPWGPDDKESGPDVRAVVSNYSLQGVESDHTNDTVEGDAAQDTGDYESLKASRVSPALGNKELEAFKLDCEGLSEEDIAAASSMLSVDGIGNDDAGALPFSSTGELNADMAEDFIASVEGVTTPENTPQPTLSASDTDETPKDVNAAGDKEPSDTTNNAATSSNEGNEQVETSQAAGSNERLTQALEKMAEKRSHLQAYLSQVTKIVVEPGMETAARYDSIKAKQAQADTEGENKDGDDEVQPYLSAPDMSLANNAAPMSDHLSKLKQITETTRKFTDSNPAKPLNESDSTVDNDNQPGNRDSASH